MANVRRLRQSNDDFALNERFTFTQVDPMFDRVSGISNFVLVEAFDFWAKTLDYEDTIRVNTRLQFSYSSNEVTLLTRRNSKFNADANRYYTDKVTNYSYSISDIEALPRTRYMVIRLTPAALPNYSEPSQ